MVRFCSGANGAITKWRTQLGFRPFGIGFWSLLLIPVCGAYDLALKICFVLLGIFLDEILFLDDFMLVSE